MIACAGWVLVCVFCACDSFPQQDPKTKRGMGGMKIFSRPFRQVSSEPKRRTCSQTTPSGVYTASPRRCHPPSPDNLTASDRVLSACWNRTLVFPNRSWTKTVRGSDSVSRIFATIEKTDLALKCQFLSVRSVTTTPLAVMCGIVRDMWLESEITRRRVEGTVFPSKLLGPISYLLQSSRKDQYPTSFRPLLL